MTTLISIDETEPIDLSYVKSPYIKGTDLDVEINSLISVAREYVEGETWVQIIPATFEQTLDEFPCLNHRHYKKDYDDRGYDQYYPHSDEIRLSKWPVRSVTKIEYVDEDGSTQELDSTAYQVDLNRGRIRSTDGWPASKEQYNAVTVTYKAGYDYSENRLEVPEKIKKAVKFLVMHWINNQSAVMTGNGRSVDVEEVPFTVRALLNMCSRKTLT